MLVRIILFMFMVSLLPKIGKVLFNRLTGNSATWSCSMGNDMKSTNPVSQSQLEVKKKGVKIKTHVQRPLPSTNSTSPGNAVSLIP